ncbi:hypothetical protein ES705_30209 [subsurface metagenome]
MGSPAGPWGSSVGTPPTVGPPSGRVRGRRRQQGPGGTPPGSPRSPPTAPGEKNGGVDRCARTEMCGAGTRSIKNGLIGPLRME